MSHDTSVPDTMGLFRQCVYWSALVLFLDQRTAYEMLIRDWSSDVCSSYLDRRREHTLAMGGPERVAKHHAKGRLVVRARIDRLVDAGTCREFGSFAGGEIAADGIVTGSGLINGAPVMVGAEDFTTLAGSIGSTGNAKRYRLAELAVRDKIPLVMLLEG